MIPRFALLVMRHAPMRAFAAKAKVAVEPSKSLEEVYQKKTPIEHVLLRPEMYLGSVTLLTKREWVYNSEEERMELKEVGLVPGLCKVFDEILVNAADAAAREKSVKNIYVDFEEGGSTISIANDGASVPVQIHKEHNVYIPEMVFGHMLTSSNFDDTTARMTGGRHGHGAKLTNIFSRKFQLEIADTERKLHFFQEWSDNMQTISPPEVRRLNSDEFSKGLLRVTFEPEFDRFGVSALDADHISFFKKRVFDLAGLCEGVDVHLNGEIIPVKNMVDLTSKYLSPEINGNFTHFKSADNRWFLSVGASDGESQIVSFVNSVCTINGGTHVTAVQDVLVKEIQKYLIKTLQVKNVAPSLIKNNMCLILSLNVSNPTFASQTKDTLTLPKKKWDTKFEPSEKFLRSVLTDTEIVERVTSLVNVFPTTKNTSREKRMNFPKLEDAELAGTKHWSECTLIITEGDSAKSLAVAGLSVIGRSKFGVVPVRGKLMNVSRASVGKVRDNEEFNMLKSILGLTHSSNHIVENEKGEVLPTGLRYGKVLIMADQDGDGSHIRGLLFSMFYTYWPELLKTDFVQIFITPLVKAIPIGDGAEKRGTLPFFQLRAFEQWYESQPNKSLWRCKYYKGLGTSTAAEAREYFMNLSRHCISMKWAGEADGKALNTAFGVAGVGERKSWINFIANENAATQTMGYDVKTLTYTQFVENELIPFAKDSCLRTLPSAIDGLKPGQRKILYSALTRGGDEFKVSQLAGYTADVTQYHHGEISLTNAITNMAQDFVGSNNLPLLDGIGQFGTRLQGGDDAASSRYIFVKVSPWTRLIFPEVDEKLLTYSFEDTSALEPTLYAPIIPMVLVNGCRGIALGWSTNLPAFNPLDVIHHTLHRLGRKVENLKVLEPWYRSFTGEIKRYGDNDTYMSCGKFSLHPKAKNKLIISELPIGRWVHNYKEFLYQWCDGRVKVSKLPRLKDFTERHTVSQVEFILTFSSDVDFKAEKLDEETTMAAMKLTTQFSLINCHLFDDTDSLRKFKNAEEIFDVFIPFRLQLYEKRREIQISTMKNSLQNLKNQLRFISLITSSELSPSLLAVPEKKAVEILLSKGFDRCAAVEKKPDSTSDFDYLLKMQFCDLNKEKMDHLKKRVEKEEAELRNYEKKSAIDIWASELEVLAKAIEPYCKQRDQ